MNVPPPREQRAERQPSSTPSTALLVAGVVAAIAALWLDDTALLWLRFGGVMAGTIAVLVAIRWHRPRRPRPWLLLAAGLFASSIGQFARATAGDTATSDTPTVSVWLAVAGVLVLAATLDAAIQVRGPDPGSALDASLLAVALWMLLWQLWLVPAGGPGWIGSGSEMIAGVQVVLFAVFVAVFALLVQTVRAVPAGSRTPLVLLTVAVLGAVGGFLFDVVGQAMQLAEQPSALRTILGLVTNVTPGAAALHPAMRIVDERQTAATDEFTLLRFVGFALAMLAPPLVLLGADLRGQQIGYRSLALFWALFVPGVVARMSLLVAGRQAARSQAEASDRRMRSLVAHTGDLLLVIDPGSQPRIRYASPASIRVLGIPAEELVGTCAFELPVDDERTYRAILIDDGPLPRQSDVQMQHRDGRNRWMEVVADHHDDVDGPALVVAIADITDRKQAEIRWVEAALRDELTGLLNRRGVDQWLEDALEDLSTDGRRIGVLLADLDGFKQVNDTGGHPVGDQVLQHVARRFERVLRDADVVGRIGGDEFVVLVPIDGGIDQLRAVADRLTAAVDAPVVVGDHHWPIGVSLGVSVIDDTDTSVAQALRRADVALYRAKAAGKGRAEWDEALQVT